jgi:CAAX protease family protein
MTKIILENILRLLIIMPLILVFIKKHNKENYLRIIIFIICFLGYQLAIRLPYLIDTFNFINGNWNWDGKIIGIFFSIICFFVFKSYFKENNFFTLKQDKKNIKAASIVSIGIVILATVIWFIFGKSEFNIEALAFQLTLPGIDEELMYRGILLGLLMSSMKSKINFLGNPSVLITAILFGLIHALTINKDSTINFELIYFLQTGLAGYAWGWVTIKSRSLVLAILSHNFSNFFGTLVTMIK